MFTKRLFNVLSAVFLGCALAFASSGKAGKDIKWELKKGVLTFTGSGPMKKFPKETPYLPELVKEVHIGEGITSIGENAFRECKNLKSVDLPSSITTIGNKAFFRCANLSNITIPYGVTSIGENAFSGCKSLVQLELPLTVKSIGEKAFADCSILTYARLTQSLESIGDDAFSNCPQLVNLTDIPPYIDLASCGQYGFSRLAVQKYWDRKEEIASTFDKTSENHLSDNSTQKATASHSDVDIDIPFTGLNNPNTFVVIIANENYGKLADVPFALNDGNTFALYCTRTLGVPEKNILQFNNATYGSIKAAFSDLRLINDVVGNDMKVIFYYAGHGAPDDATLEPYLVPIDAGRINKDVCVSLASIYGQLGSMNLKSATVFLDACFSGATRDGSMVVAARGIARVPKKQDLSGKVVVFSATSADQTAMPYSDKYHGMFTYYLLKHLQETKGNVSLMDLKDYLNQNVSRNSTIINRKEQTPTVISSPAASSEWDSWKLID